MTTTTRPGCQVGMQTPCGQPATEAIAVQGLALWVSEPVTDGTNGVLYLCAHHAGIPVSRWDDAVETDAPLLSFITTTIVHRPDGLTKTVVVSLPDGPVYRETFHTSMSDQDCTEFALRGFADYQTQLINTRLDELEPVQSPADDLVSD